jgi:hypothetical protein
MNSQENVIELLNMLWLIYYDFKIAMDYARTGDIHEPDDTVIDIRNRLKKLLEKYENHYSDIKKQYKCTNLFQ